MDKRNSIKLLFALGILVTAACLCTNITDSVLPKPAATNTPTFTSKPSPGVFVGTEELPAATVPPTVPPPTATPPDRCAYFDGLEVKFTFHTIVEGDETMTMYLNITGGVPGLEKVIPGDSGPFDYSATIGGLWSIKCNLREYANRLYCVFPLKTTYYNTARKFDLFLEGCATAVFSHDYLTIPVKTQPPP
jgi:hypothetical protein